MCAALLSFFRKKSPDFLRIQFRRGYATPGEGKCFYETLHLKPGASSQEIKDAYYKLSKKYHPDMNSGSTEATAKIQEINEAFDVLGNAARKIEYDRAIGKPMIRHGKGTFIYDMEEPKFYYHKPPPQTENSPESEENERFKVLHRPGGKTAAGIAKRRNKHAIVNTHYRKEFAVKAFSGMNRP